VSGNVRPILHFALFHHETVAGSITPIPDIVRLHSTYQPAIRSTIAGSTHLDHAVPSPYASEVGAPRFGGGGVCLCV
jgi:hypothetical protein